jgi:hypothetical protein
MDTAVPRTRDKLSLLLIFIAILVAAGRALTTEWVPRLENVEILAALGLLLGFALGASRFSRRAVAWLAAAYSLVVVPWQLSKIVESAVSFEERLSGLGGRLLYSFIQLFSGQEVEDFVLFLAFISLVFWFLGLYAGYQITRHGKFLGAIIFAGFVIILIHTYDGGFPARINFLGVFLFFTLLLLGRLIYLREVQVWKTRHIVLPP